MSIMIVIDCNYENGMFSGHITSIEFSSGDCLASTLLVLTADCEVPFGYCNERGIMVNDEAFTIKSMAHIPDANMPIYDQIGISVSEAERLANYLKKMGCWFVEDGNAYNYDAFESEDGVVDFSEEKL